VFIGRRGREAVIVLPVAGDVDRAEQAGRRAFQMGRGKAERVAERGGEILVVARGAQDAFGDG
jgi:hypothetical protein